MNARAGGWWTLSRSVGRRRVPVARALAAILVLAVPGGATGAAEPPSSPACGFVDAEAALRAVFARDDLAGVQPDRIRSELVRLAEGLPPGGAIQLPESVPCGLLDLRGVADDVQITGGRDGKIVLGGGQQGIQLLFCALDQEIRRGRRRPASRARPTELAAAGRPDRYRLFDPDPDLRPASGLVALFCEGSIHIRHDVERCAWMCGTNAFGRRVVTAEARVDDSLFLWFGINWPFQDYNAHRDSSRQGTDWLENAQMWFDARGGGRGTRLYLMVETNYGNPGPGVVLMNCHGLALYHGTTERASSQGPGVYWLKDCHGVKLGLRGINAFMIKAHRKSPEPTHDITIEGGRGNILHAIRSWGYPTGASAVCSDPELQVWSVCFEHETEGVERDSVLRFCYTPHHARPTPEWLEEHAEELEPLARRVLEARGEKATDESVRRRVAEMRTGRHVDAPMNALDEQTFVFEGKDLTRLDPQAMAATRIEGRLPPPPSMPATDAPRVGRPIEFTQQPGFGEGLLEAGADPTGQRPSDDAFARTLYGVSRDELDDLLEESYRADAALRRARKSGDRSAESAARARIERVLDRLQPRSDPTRPGSRRVRDRQLHVGPGVFLLRRPLFLLGCRALWGAGPERTTLRTDAPIAVIEQHSPGTISNLSVEGGRVGLAITGADHGDMVSPTLHSYVAGQNYFRLTFRDQSFAGIHIGSDRIDRMGGAEHDQNKYVEIRCLHTGEYGIYVNTSMLDKWLLLHGEFEGQTKAGIAIPFNNVIKGAVIGSRFRDIRGPALALMGGNPMIAYRPSLVMVDQCEFIECGDADHAAVDLGYCSLASFTRCRVSTRSRTIRHGLIGAPMIQEDVDIDVRVPEGAPAVVLRAVRNGSVARANGHTLRDVRSSGPLAFVNDSEDHNEVFAATLEERGRSEPPRWDTNPAARELAPRSGWAHPFLLYRCRFGERTYDYSLLDVDTDAGRVEREVDLSPLMRERS